MFASPAAVRAVLPLLLLTLALCACGRSSSAIEAPPPMVETLAPEPTATLPPPPDTPTAVPTATATSVPVPTATPAPPVAPTATSAPPPAATDAGLSVDPPSIGQGGVAVVYLNQPATAAMLRFNRKNYPMLPDGDRWWAIIGSGAFDETGAWAITVTYTTPAGTPATASANLDIRDAGYEVENIDLDASTSALLAPDIVTAELNKRAGIYSAYTPEKLWSGPFVRPSAAPLSDTYGVARGYNGAPPTSYHTGTDFAAQQGAPVVAAAAGRVVFAGALTVRGNSVIIDHGAGVFTAYHHFSQIDVVAGQAVAAGERIGAVGSTGLVTGPHLHWEVIVRSQEVDGLLWLQGETIGP